MLQVPQQLYQRMNQSSSTLFVPIGAEQVYILLRKAKCRSRALDSKRSEDGVTATTYEPPDLKISHAYLIYLRINVSTVVTGTSNGTVEETFFGC